MTQPSTVSIPTNHLSQTLKRLLGVVMMWAWLGIWMMLVGGTVGTAGTIVGLTMGGLSTVLVVFHWAFLFIRQRPRIVVTPEGFTLYKDFGEESHRWADIDGQFAVIKIVFTKRVAYNLTADYKLRVRKSRPVWKGFDAVIMGSYTFSAEQLAELLNNYKQRSVRPRPSGGTEPNPTCEVFISYSSHDKHLADATCAVLEGHRIRCWIAPRDIVPGTEWGASIIGGLDSCRIMVLIFSTHANESGQVRREVERAISKGLTVLPIRVEDVRPEGAMEYALSSTHWLDALTPPVETHLHTLAVSVQLLLAKGQVGAGVARARPAK